jgi:diadenosine tetraphosphatase ApaH/serine/threonine PP2A family protein phosphatase
MVLLHRSHQMRILVLSDIHANLAALEAVLEAANDQWDRIWCLGDLVGYGPNPNECIALLREFDHLSLSGNHDWAVLGKLNIAEFNEDARSVVLWTSSELEPESRTYLESLPPIRVVEGFTLAHGSPRHPVWEYVLDYETAVANFAHFETPCCLIGHSHIPLHIVELKSEDLLIEEVVNNEVVSLKNQRVMLNPGSVGQPRDDDPRAAYALLDIVNLTWQFGRVPYAIEKTQEQMRQENFPIALIERLSYGW